MQEAVEFVDVGLFALIIQRWIDIFRVIAEEFFHSCRRSIAGVERVIHDIVVAAVCDKILRIYDDLFTLHHAVAITERSRHGHQCCHGVFHIVVFFCALFVSHCFRNIIQ